MRISTVSGLRGVPRGARYYLRHMPFVLRCGAVALLVVALARPQSSQSDSSRTTEGIDIVLSLDISGSMLARRFPARPDFRPPRRWPRVSRGPAERPDRSGRFRRGEFHAKPADDR